MQKKKIGEMLALLNISAEQIAEIEGIKGNSQKAPIVGILIQNLHESLLAIDKGVDVVGTTITTEEIGDGLQNMLEFMRGQNHWAILQEGLSIKDTKCITKLADQIHATAIALTSSKVDQKIDRPLPSNNPKPIPPPEQYQQILSGIEVNLNNKKIGYVLIFIGTLIGYILIYASWLDFTKPGVKPEYILSAVLIIASLGLILIGARLTVRWYGPIAISLFVLIIIHLIITLKSILHYAQYRKDILREEIAVVLSGPDLWIPIFLSILAMVFFVTHRRKGTKAETDNDTSSKPNSKNQKVQHKERVDTEEIIKLLDIADEKLYQINDPDYETNLANRLFMSPKATFRAIEFRGWKKRGKSEETNSFVIRILSRFFNDGERETKERVIETLVNIFTTPDDNTSGWVNLLEQSAKILAQSNMPGTKEKLESLRLTVPVKNREAIDYTLNLLKSTPVSTNPNNSKKTQ